MTLCLSLPGQKRSAGIGDEESAIRIGEVG